MAEHDCSESAISGYPTALHRRALFDISPPLLVFTIDQLLKARMLHSGVNRTGRQGNVDPSRAAPWSTRSPGMVKLTAVARSTVSHADPAGMHTVWRET